MIRRRDHLPVHRLELGNIADVSDAEVGYDVIPRCICPNIELLECLFKSKH